MESVSNSRRGSWVIWIGTVVAASSIAVATRIGVEVSRLQYETAGLNELPSLTRFALTMASNLWVAVLVSAAAGIWAARDGRRRTLGWSMVSMLLFIIAAALIAKGLALPFELADPTPLK